MAAVLVVGAVMGVAAWGLVNEKTKNTTGSTDNDSAHVALYHETFRNPLILNRHRVLNALRSADPRNPSGLTPKRQADNSFDIQASILENAMENYQPPKIPFNVAAAGYYTPAPGRLDTSRRFYTDN